ncbi:rhodanese-like domain-containing protein [Sphingobacterium corticis]|uniref:Rhodanese-like domain-containing protein n=1 Tax=Sphingobacterium corticis TaxID=1812823 RepID=A0ABW5NMN4_9SPHI
MKILLIISIVFTLIYTAYRIFYKMNQSGNLNTLLEKNAIILDVRTSVEYARGHIINATNIPLGELRTRFTELDKSKTYITVCSHGLRSVKALNLLKERGFVHVYNGGSWEDLSKKHSLSTR